MESFRIVSPSAALAAFVKQYWILRVGAASERIIPAGNIQLSFYSGASLLLGEEAWNSQAVLCGQSTDFADLRTTGEIRILSVVFQPYGARVFFQMPMMELCGHKIAVGDLNDPQLHELEQRIIATPDDDACIGLIETYLMKRLQGQRDYNYRRMLSAVELVNKNRGEVRLADLAGETCLSSKQFQRVFTDYVGAKPKDFLRIVRFQYALSVLQHTPGITFTRLAHECGYYDQSHLTNEFRRFSGYTPGEYLAICRPYSDYFVE